MLKHLAPAFAVTLMAACSHEGNSPSSKSDWGTGLNTIARTYDKPASETYSAAVAAIKSLNMTIDKDLHDELGGELTARRAEGNEILVNVTVLDKSSSEAVVRVNPGNSTIATQIHEKIADKLGMGKAKGALLGGNTDEYPYNAELQAGVDAAERTFKALGWNVSAKEIKDTWAQIDARAVNSEPAKIRMERVSDRAFPLKVRFTAGNGNIDGSKQMIDRMREEFARQLGASAR